MKETIIDKDLISSIINQLWRLVSGPVTMIFITLYLTEIEQGYWYTFLSLSALSIFADLGFSSIMLQFSAHEVGNLTIKDGILYSADPKYFFHIQKLGKLLRFIVKWVSTLFFLTFPLIFCVGYFVFSKKDENISWLVPWIIFILGSGIGFINQGVLSFLEGCNQVAQIQFIRFIASIIQTLIIFIFLYLRLNLYAIAIASLISSLSINILIQVFYKKLVNQLWTVSKNYNFSWKKEFLSLFWRYSLSWASGYFIFQIFTPLAFNYYGSEFAGKIGFSLALINAGFAISTVWLTSILPKLGMYIATKNWVSLDSLFEKRFLLGLLTYLLGFGTFFIIFLFFQEKSFFFKRFLPPIPFLCLLLAWLIQYIVSSLAFYMRAHKEEPLVWLSLISGLSVSLSTVLIVFFLNSNFIFTGFLLTQIIFFPFVIRYYRIYKYKRHQ